MSNEVEIDGVLQHWGERLFYAPIKAKKGATRALFTAPKKGGGQGGGELAGAKTKAVREKLQATAKKTPEVLVKITGSGKTIRMIKAHMDYISRNGELELEDQDGQIVAGKEAVRDLRDEWRDGKFVIPTEEGTQRESFNIVLSMPAGTSRATVTDAARAFAKERFGGQHDYVFAQHDDQPQSHVHLLVKARNYEGVRMNPRKADLQEWREQFAEKLRERGIEANATKRQVRGITKKPQTRAQHHTHKKGTKAKYFPDKRPIDPFAAKTATTQQTVLRSYKEVATALASSPDKLDVKLARDIVGLVADMPTVRERVPAPTRDQVQRPSQEQSRAVKAPRSQDDKER